MADTSDLGQQAELLAQINSLLAKRCDLEAKIASSCGQQGAMAGEMAAATGQQAQGLKQLGGGWSEVNDALDEGSKKQKNITKDSKSFLKTMLDKSKGIGGAAIGLGVFTKGLKFAAQGLKGAAMAGKSFVKGVFNIGKSILKIPFKVFGGLISMANKNASAGTALRQAYEDVRKEFGSFSEGPAKNVIAGFNDMTSSAGNLAGTGLSASRVFGYGPDGMAKMMGAVADIAKGLGPAINLLGDEFGKVAEQAVMFSKGLGLSGEQMGKLMKDAKLSGKSQTDMMTEVGSMSLQMADKFGLSSKDIGRDIADMKSDFVSFGNVSTTEMAAASAYARSLGMDMKDLKGVVDKFDDFEGAAESVGQLNQAFGIQLDTMKMMNAENPAERIDMMRKAFFQAGKSVENMTRQEKKLLMQQTGLTESALKNAFAAENQGVAYEDFADAAADAEEDQLSQEEVMLKLADAIEKVAAAGPGFTGMFDAFSKGFMKAVMYDKDMKELFRTIRSMLRAVFRLGKEFGKFFVALLKGSGVIKALKDFFNPKIITEFTGVVTPVLKDLAKFLTTGEGDPNKIFDKFFGALDDMFTARGKAGKAVLGSVGRLAKMFVTLFDRVVAWATPKIMPYLQGMFKRISKFFGKGGAGSGMTKALGGLLLKVFVGAIKGALSATGGAIKALGKSFKQWFDKDAPNAVRAAATGANMLGVGAKIMGKFGVALNPVAAMAMASASFSKGFENMEKSVDKGITGVNRQLSVGAASYVELLTFGLMPDSVSTEVGNFMGKLLGTIDGFAKQIGAESIWGAMKERIGGTIEMFRGLGDMVRGLFSGDSDKVQEGLERITKGFIQKIKGTFKLIGIIVKAIFTKLVPFVFKALMNVAKTILKWTVTHLPMTIYKGLKAIVVGVGKAIMGLFSFFFDPKYRSEMLTKAINFAGGIYEGLVEGLSRFIGYMAEWLGDIWTTFTEFWGINSPSTKMAEAGDNLIDGIISTLMYLPNKFVEIASKAWKGITSAFSAAASWAGGLIETIAGGLSSFGKRAAGIASKAWESITGVFSGIWEWASGIGGNVVDGILDGLSNLAQRAKDKLSEMKDAALDIFSIGSPSKWFQNEVGKNIGEGMIIGLDQTAGPGMEKSMSSLKDKAESGIKGGNFQTGMGDSIVKEVKAMGPLLVAATTAAMMQMGEAFKEGGNFIGKLFNSSIAGTINDVLGAIFGEIPKKIISSLSGVFPVLKDAFFKMAKLVKIGMKLFSSTFKTSNIGDMFKSVMNTVGSVAKRVLNLVTKQMIKLSTVIGIMGKRSMGMSKLSIFSRQNKNIFLSLSYMFKDMVRVLRKIKFQVVHATLQNVLHSVQMLDETFSLLGKMKPTDIGGKGLFSQSFSDKILDSFDQIGIMLSEIGYITEMHLGSYDNRPTQAMYKAIVETAKISKMIKRSFAGEAGTVVQVVSAMVQAYNDTYSALTDASQQEIPLKVALDNFANKVGVGNETFTVKNEKLNFTVNVAVVLDAEKMTDTLTNRRIMGQRTLKKALE